MLPTKHVRITPSQLNYIRCLGIDLSLTDIQLKDIIYTAINREFNYMDEISKSEASTIISYLREKKYK